MSAGTASAARPAKSGGGMFRSLRLPNYRTWVIGALVSNVGQWMESTALSWVVLTVLTADNAAAMGVSMALQFGPPLFLFSITGWVADRVPRRRILFVTQSSLAIVSTLVGILVLTDVMTLPLMYVFNLVVGCCNAFDNPARQAFVTDVVPREFASNAVALNSASFNTARLLGPGVAGIAIIAIGPGWVFIANATSFIAMIIALSLIKRELLIPRERPKTQPRFADGFRYLRTRPDLITLYVMVFLMGTFAMNFQIFASTMALHFGGDADAYGLLSSIMAVGSLGGALLSAQRKQATMRWIIVASLFVGLSLLGGALSPTYWWYAVLCVITGFATVTMLTTANAYVQTTTRADVRGRILAIYFALMMGGTFIGAPVVGWVAENWGPQVALAVGGTAAVLAFGVGLVTLLLRRRQIAERETGAIPIAEALAEEKDLPTGAIQIDGSADAPRG